MTITGTGGTGCDDRLQPHEFRSPPASARQGNHLLLEAPSSATADETDEVWCTEQRNSALAPPHEVGGAGSLQVAEVAESIS